MVSSKQYREKADEAGDLAVVAASIMPEFLPKNAMDTWESEGGSSRTTVGGIDAAHTALADIARWRADNNAGWRANNFDNTSPKQAQDSLPVLTFAGEEDGILRCLGAAVIMRWNTIPTKLQRELFDNASTIGDLLQSGALKGRIARFLHKHKDDQG